MPSLGDVVGTLQRGFRLLASRAAEHHDASPDVHTLHTSGRISHTPSSWVAFDRKPPRLASAMLSKQREGISHPGQGNMPENPRFELVDSQVLCDCSPGLHAISLSARPSAGRFSQYLLCTSCKALLEQMPPMNLTLRFPTVRDLMH